MDYINLTKEVREYFGIKNAHITYKSHDYIIMLNMINDSNVVFTIPNIFKNINESVDLFFPSKEGKVSLKLNVIKIQIRDDLAIIECEIVGCSNISFMHEIRKYYEELEQEKKRKENRIVCTLQNLQLLRLIGKYQIEYKNIFYKCIIKDISFSGIRVLTSPLLLAIKDELFSFKLTFTEPEEKFLFVNCKVVRKKSFTFEKYEFAELVFKLPENIKFRKRLLEYFNLPNSNAIKARKI